MKELALVLHAHLPWVREREPWSKTERWFHEAVWECYGPLARWLNATHARMTLSVSPPLLAMMGDPILAARGRAHVARLAELNHIHAPNRTLREHYEERLSAPVETLLEPREHVELLTTSVAHAFLPGLAPVAGAHAQLAVGRACLPGTSCMWLPECAWAREVDVALARLDVPATVLDAHAIALARPAVGGGGLVSSRGVAYLARHQPACLKVWSSADGYPAHGDYRDFYRDLGLDHDISPFGGQMSGLKYHRIAEAGGNKRLYEPDEAAARVERDAEDFVRLLTTLDADTVLLAFDAELFGHWWHEGVEFLEALFRRLAQGGVSFATLSDVAARSWPVSEPAASTWGRGGFAGDWVNPRVAWCWREIHRAHRGVVDATRRNADCSGDRGQALDHAIEATLLAEASDWMFMLTHREHSEYARRRIEGHLAFAARMRRVAEGAPPSRSETEALRLPRTVTASVSSAALREAMTSITAW